MPTCPKCGKEIQKLISVESGTITYDFVLWKDHECWEDGDFEADGKVSDFLCPLCNEVLTNDSVKAAEILGKVFKDGEIGTCKKC